MLQHKSKDKLKLKKSHVHGEYNSNDEEGWDAPEWLNAHSIYPEDEDVPIFSGRDIRKLSLRGARLILAELGGVDARKVDFTRSELSGADLSTANLRHAIFAHADLCKANLRSADLCGADLSGADLMMATLAGADLSGARLNGACIDETDFTDATFDHETELPFDEAEALRRGMRKNGMSKHHPSGGVYD